MDFITQLFGKSSNYSSEYKRFKKSMEKNPHDHGLKAQFVKFCLLSRFSGQEIQEDHIVEALALFETIAQTDAFDLQCHYLVGKYYQEDKNVRKAYRVYLEAIRRFNEHVGQNPELKSENAELAYSIALNVMALQSNPTDPELEKCFKIIRRSFPLHVKRFELENEMAKPAPDKARVKQLAAEVKKLKAEEDQENQPPVAAEEMKTASFNVRAEVKEIPEEKKTASFKVREEPKEEKKDIFSRLLSTHIPVPQAGGQGGDTKAGKSERWDALKLSPVSEFAHPNASFMVFHNGHWEGPYTPTQLRTMDFFKPATWVCRSGSQQVLQAYEAPELMSIFQQFV